MAEREDSAVASLRELLAERWSPEKIRAMSTAAILEKLASFGVTISEEDFIRSTAAHFSAEDLSEEWWASFPCMARDLDEDFPWMAAMVLWERLAPDRPSNEMIVDLIDEGYDESDDARACDRWLKAWDALKHRLTPAVTNLTGLEAAFDDLSIPDWCDDVVQALHNAGRADPAYYRHLIQFCQDVYTHFTDEGPIVLAGFYRAEGEALWLLGQRNEAETKLAELIQRCPNLADSYSAWAECHLLWAESRREGQKRALAIYQLALENQDLEDRELIYWHLAHLHHTRHDQRQRDHYRHLAKIELRRKQGPTARTRHLRARVGRALAAADFRLGRNDPCRCGSGKKYKRCHLPIDEREARRSREREP